MTPATVPVLRFGALRRADVDLRLLRKALEGLKWIGFADDATADLRDAVWFDATRIRRAERAMRRFRDACCVIDLERRELHFHWRDRRGGLRLRDSHYAYVAYSEALRERRARKAERLGKPEPTAVTQVLVGLGGAP